MKKILFSATMLLAGCDMSYGLKLPVEPEYNGDLACLTESIADIGLIPGIHNGNQLSVSSSDSGKNLFYVIPSYRGAMELYFMQVHAPPDCADVEYSLAKMKEFVLQIEKKCGYKAESYRIDMQCGSNKSFNGTALRAAR